MWKPELVLKCPLELEAELRQSRFLFSAKVMAVPSSISLLICSPESLVIWADSVSQYTKGLKMLKQVVGERWILYAATVSPHRLSALKFQIMN